MSAGPFTDTFYEASEDNGGETWNIRVQPETITAWNPAATGPALADVSVNVSGSRRRNGIHARMARFRWQGAPPAGYAANSIIQLPILTAAAYSALVKNTDYAYLAGNLRLVGKSPERFR